MTSVAEKDESKDSFETALSRLEQIVGSLEKGDLSLEDSLKLYEEGISRARFCQERLGEAETKIEVLSQDARRVLDRAAKAEPPR
jgi:exodeoxyribonuclease VII small subunit